MRVLVTNDDGIYAPGLWSVARALSDVADVSVVAPDRDQSGVGTAMTLRTALQAQSISSPIDGIEAFSVQGTPADCVILATGPLFSEPFDLLVSGINSGSNLGLDFLVSGTVGGALHGYLRNIPSIATSVASLTDAHYEAASRITTELARALDGSPLPETPLLNVNLPNVEAAAIEAVEITRPGPTAFLENVERVQEGHRTYYWIRHNRPVADHPAKGTDIWAVENGRTSITPLDLAFTRGPRPGLSRTWSARCAPRWGLCAVAQITLRIPPPALTVLGTTPNPYQRGLRPSLDSPAGQSKRGVA